MGAEATGVRGFDARDRAELRDVFRRAGDGEGALPFGDLEELLWLTPYMDGEPESLLVATRDGRLVGYLTGCLDSSAMPTEEERVNRLLAQHRRLLLRPRTVQFFARCVLDIARARRGRTAAEFSDARWPAHLHIRLVPEARGLGLGAALMSRWLERLRQVGSPGCHLQTLAENTHAIDFFERMGFEKHGEALVIPGLRGEQGRRLHQQTMVWSP